MLFCLIWRGMNRCDRAGKRVGYGWNISLSSRVGLSCRTGCAAWYEEIIIQAIDSRQIEGYLKIFIRFQVAFCVPRGA